MFADNEQLRESLQQLQKNFLAHEGYGHWTRWAIVASGLLSLLNAIGVAVLLFAESHQRTDEAEVRRSQAEQPSDTLSPLKGQLFEPSPSARFFTYGFCCCCCPLKGQRTMGLSWAINAAITCFNGSKANHMSKQSKNQG